MLVVEQPQKLETLLGALDTIERFTENMAEDKSGDMGGGGTGGQQGDDGSGASQSTRDQAIASLPEAKVMQKKLDKHIRREAKKLRKEIRKISRIRSPGAACKVNELYSKIRRLNGLVSELLDASYDVLKRMFIRIFVDKQPVTSL